MPDHKPAAKTEHKKTLPTTWTRMSMVPPSVVNIFHRNHQVNDIYELICPWRGSKAPITHKLGAAAGKSCKLFDRLGPDGGARYDARTFLDAIGPIRRDGLQYFGRPRGPEDLYLVHLTRTPQAEVKPEVALREIAAAAAHFVRLCEAAGGELDARIQRQFVAPGPGEFEPDPVIGRSSS